jgi:hypothetical protein
LNSGPPAPKPAGLPLGSPSFSILVLMINELEEYLVVARCTEIWLSMHGVPRIFTLANKGRNASGRSSALTEINPPVLCQMLLRISGRYALWFAEESLIQIRPPQPKFLLFQSLPQTLQPSPPNASRYTVASVSAPLLRAWIHCPRAPERFVPALPCRLRAMGRTV